MSKKKQNKEDVAVNRLLDLLRVQQVSEEEDTHVSEKIDETEAALPIETEAVSESEDQIIESSDTVDGTNAIIEEENKAIVASEEKTAETEPVVGEEYKKESEIDEINLLADEVNEVIDADETEDNDPELVDETIELIEDVESGENKVTLLDDIMTSTVNENEIDEEEVEPEEFDSSLFSPLNDKKYKRDSRSVLHAFFNKFNESWRRVTIHITDKTIWLLQLKTGLKETEIENFGEYNIPYQDGDKTIENMDDLLPYVLENEVNSKQKKSAFGSFFSSKFVTKTRRTETPRLKHKELVELVDWTAKKDLPFNPDQALVNWESTSSVGDLNKQNIVIGIAEKDSLNKTIDIFQENRLKPRMFTTLPILLYKLFIRNYPDRKSRCYILVHIGETNTTIVVLEDHKYIFSREIIFGAQDFYKALDKKKMNETMIDYPMAKEILQQYGFPQAGSGVTTGSKISLYKISIFLRPVVERLTGELSRSLKYFKKQNPKLKWEEMLFDGVGASFPHLLDVIHENLELKVSLLNPIRRGKYNYQSGCVIPDKLLSTYSVNFALATEEIEGINLIPSNLRSNFRYIFLSKVMIAIVAFLIPFFSMTAFFTYSKFNHVVKQVESKTKKWENLSVQAKEYSGLMGDMEILDAYKSYMKNDKTYSHNQVSLLKLISSIIPKHIKLTSLAFNKEASNDGGDEFHDVLKLDGFVQANASVADIYLTNFIINIEELPYFTSLNTDIKDHNQPGDEKLFFL